MGSIASLGLVPCFVMKKGGALRLIFDTRVSSCNFGTPPSTDLMGPQGMADLLCESDKLHVGRGRSERFLLVSGSYLASRILLLAGDQGRLLGWGLLQRQRSERRCLDLPAGASLAHGLELGHLSLSAYGRACDPAPWGSQQEPPDLGTTPCA